MGGYVPTMGYLRRAYVSWRSDGDDEADRAAGAEWDRALAEHDAQVWDEAYQAGAYDTLRSPRDARENPYRADAVTRQAEAWLNAADDEGGQE